MHHEDTICAIATAPGGAIGIVRVSGPQAIALTSHIFTPLRGLPLEERQAYTVTFGHIMDGANVVDEVLVTLFRSPHSYTGEDCVEISCHGSAYILQTVMRLLVEQGCRTAAPGEYTQRAFLNGKMDLSQAEAVADLIASSSAANHRLAMNQMRGGFSKELSALRDRLLHLTALLELELDFSDHEELEFADRTELSQLAAEIETVISDLINSFTLGNAIKNGIPVAIIGETNAGKSTLLNALVGEERAIVSNIHGTTRDVIEDTVNIGGTTFRFIDTAGIRQTTDEIESLGIRRTFEKLNQARIVLWLIDSTDADTQLARLAPQVLPQIGDKQLILLFNKADLATPSPSLPDTLPLPQGTKVLILSAKEHSHINELQALLTQAANLPTLSPDAVIITNTRHFEALTHALSSIRRVQDALSLGTSGDLVSEDLRECIHHLSTITGAISDTEVLTRIFSRFCVGK